MTINAANLAVCQEALYLLRQDVGLPPVAEQPTDPTLQWQKRRMAFETMVAEVWGAHDWNAELKLTGANLTAAPGDVTNWTAPMRTALAYGVASELAVPLAGRVEDLKNWTSLYQDKLSRARVLSLENERRTITDAVHAELLALLVPSFDPADNHLPRSLKAITDRADELTDSARYAILSDHAWNFVRAEDPTPSCPVPHGCGTYPYAAEVPTGCVHLEAVYSHAGRLADWKIFEGHIIVSRDPVVKAVYTLDESRLDRWPPLARRAFMYRLAADTAQTTVPNLFQALEAKAAEALSEAKVRDARENSTPRDAWGRNHYVDAMHGNRPYGPHLPRHSYHGLI